MKKITSVSISLVMALLLVCFTIFMMATFNSSLAAPYIAENVISVDTLVDEIVNDGNCSLREAITAANTNNAVDACPAGDPVTTDMITFELSGIIIVTEQLSVNPAGKLVIDGAGVVSISGGNSVRLFLVNTDANLLLENISLLYGEAPQGGAISNLGTLEISGTTLSGNQATGSMIAMALGGAIYNQGTLLINNSTLTGNAATCTCIAAYGGAIANTTASGIATIHNSSIILNSSDNRGGGVYNNGDLTIDESSITFNSSTDGGGIYNVDAYGFITMTNSIIDINDAQTGGGIYNMETLVMTNTIIEGNSAISSGGGLENRGSVSIYSSTMNENSVVYNGGGISNIVGAVTIVDSTLVGNSVGMYGKGGGLNNQGYLVIQNSTLSNNDASAHLGMGGGIYNFNSTVVINNITFWGNSSDLGGGAIYNDTGDGTVTVGSSIVASWPRTNCTGNITDSGHNIEDSDSCGFEVAKGSMPNTNPRLGSLRDLGGFTWTHALLWRSPAIDAGDNNLCPVTDQRGISRPRDGDGDGLAICDIGAFELEKPYLLRFLPVIYQIP